MLRCYVEDNPGIWCLYAPALCYAYNMSVYSTTGTTPFDLVLSRPPSEFNRDHRPQSRARPARVQKNDYVRRLHIALQNASRSLERAQARYKRTLTKASAQREGSRQAATSSWTLTTAPLSALNLRITYLGPTVSSDTIATQS